MEKDYQQAREVTRLYDDLGEAQAKIEWLQARVTALEAEVSALLLLSQDYLRQLQHARAHMWV